MPSSQPDEQRVLPAPRVIAPIPPPDEDVDELFKHVDPLDDIDESDFLALLQGHDIAADEPGPSRPVPPPPSRPRSPSPTPSTSTAAAPRPLPINLQYPPILDDPAYSLSKRRFDWLVYTAVVNRWDTSRARQATDDVRSRLGLRVQPKGRDGFDGNHLLFSIPTIALPHLRINLSYHHFDTSKMKTKVGLWGISTPKSLCSASSYVDPVVLKRTQTLVCARGTKRYEETGSVLAGVAEIIAC